MDYDYHMPESAFVYADSSRGQYTPQYFAESVRRECVQGITESQWDVLLAGPDHADYWDVWDSVEQNALLTDGDGVKLRLWHDGDLWCVPDAYNPF